MKRALVLAGALVAGATVAIAPTAAASSSSSSAPTSGAAKVEITFFAAFDNDPKGSTDIAHPVIHQKASGTGSFADPLTFASPDGKGAYPWGTKIYVPIVRKFFVREDSCATSWTAPNGCGAVSHVDLYMGNPSTTKAVLKCEDALTPDSKATVIVNPASDLVVEPTPLWVQSSKVCGKTFPDVTPTPVPTSTPPPPPTTTPPPGPGRSYPWHTNIVSTTFWVGEIFDPKLPDGSQVCSTYDAQWAFHWSGVNQGKVPASAGGCQGAIVGGCDGAPGVSKCATEARHPENQYFPTHSNVVPRENPFYLDLPFDDINDATGFKTRCQVIPWANDPGYAGHCGDSNFSFMKNRWVRILGPNGSTCYGQIEDAGPSHGSLYHDTAYVFGDKDARPVQGQFNDAGLDVSPALNGCLGYAELDGENDHVRWQFVDSPPSGPWTRLVTTSGVTQ